MKFTQIILATLVAGSQAAKVSQRSNNVSEETQKLKEEMDTFLNDLEQSHFDFGELLDHGHELAHKLFNAFH